MRRADSVYVEMPGRLDRDHLLYTHIQVTAPPSSTTFHRVIMTDATVPGVGQLYGDLFRIRDYSGDELMLSDIALGHPSERSGWRRGDVTIALLPTTQFPGSDFNVFYEIYNLPRGRPYRTAIAVERGPELELTIDSAMIRRYEENLHAWQAELRRWCGARGVSYASISSALPVEDVVLSLLRRQGVVR